MTNPIYADVPSGLLEWALDEMTCLDLMTFAQSCVSGSEYDERLRVVLDALETCIRNEWLVAGHERPEHGDERLGPDGVVRGVVFDAWPRGQDYAIKEIGRLMKDAGPKGFPADFFFLRITDAGRRAWHERTGGKGQLRIPEYGFALRKDRPPT